MERGKAQASKIWVWFLCSKDFKLSVWPQSDMVLSILLPFSLPFSFNVPYPLERPCSYTYKGDKKRGLDGAYTVKC